MAVATLVVFVVVVVIRDFLANQTQHITEFLSQKKDQNSFFLEVQLLNFKDQMLS